MKEEINEYLNFYNPILFPFQAQMGFQTINDAEVMNQEICPKRASIQVCCSCDDC